MDSRDTEHRPTQLKCNIHLARRLKELEESRIVSRERVLNLLDEDDRIKLCIKIPPKPGMLLGRKSELQQIVASVTATSAVPARLAILGGGGMGKSTLALNALHWPEVSEAFGQHRYFISCESAGSAGGLLSVLAAHLEISGDQLRKRVLNALGSTKLLLVLDNFETPWEEYGQRVEVEQLLSAIAALQNVTLVITMRGSERPLETTWTTPVLEPLKPLDMTAARQIFSEVAVLSSEQENSSETLELLDHLDGVPLAITLAASLVRDTSVTELLASWQERGTTALQSQISPMQRLSSLDNSIRLSIQASRVADVPQALELLQLLALLPSGLAENYQHPAIKSMRRAASALKSSLLAYTAEGGYLRSLCPIRIYILRHHPPPYSLAAPLEQHYREIAKLARQLGTDRTKPLLEQLVPEWANVESVCAYTLEVNVGATWPVTVIADFDYLLSYTGLPVSNLLQRTADLSVEPSDRLRLLLRRVYRESDHDNQLKLAREAAALADKVGDIELFVESRIRLAVPLQGYAEARQHLDDALAVVRDTGPKNARQRGECLFWLSSEAENVDDYSSCIKYGVQAISCFEEAECLVEAVRVRMKLANAYLRLGHTRKAEGIVDGCIESCDAVGSMQFKPAVLDTVAFVAYARGEFLKAMRLNEEVCRIYRRRQDRQPRIAYQLETISANLIQLDDIVSARRIFEEACGLEGVRTPWQAIMQRVREAFVLVAEGAFDLAEQSAHTALQLSRSNKASRIEIIVRGILGEIALGRARDILDAEAAAAMVQHGLHHMILRLILCTRINNMMHLISCVGWLGQAFLAQQDYATARSILTWAREWATKAEVKGDLALILVAFARLEERCGSRDAKKAAWQTGLNAARVVHMSRLIAECEAGVAAMV